MNWISFYLIMIRAPYSPMTRRIVSALKKRRELSWLRNASRQEVFEYIHASNKWGSEQSRSGSGSTLEQTQRIRRELPTLLRALQLRSLLDIPCGDFFWMRQTELPIDHYIGADIVLALIEENHLHYSDGLHEFRHLDLLTDPLPPVDTILCRDCLVHFSFADIAHAVDNMKSSGATYLLTTHFPGHKRNVDIVTGKHRSLNLTLAPFHWPAPEQEILEYDAGPRRGPKHLSLWRLAELP